MQPSKQDSVNCKLEHICLFMICAQNQQCKPIKMRSHNISQSRFNDDDWFHYSAFKKMINSEDGATDSPIPTRTIRYIPSHLTMNSAIPIASHNRWYKSRRDRLTWGFLRLSLVRKKCFIGGQDRLFDIDELMDRADRKLFTHITKPSHCLHHLLPSKTSAHCSYSLRKRQHCYQPVSYTHLTLPTKRIV